MHTLGSGRFIVGIARLNGGVSSRNPPKADPPCRQRRITPLSPPTLGMTFEELTGRGTPTYANCNAAIKAARRVYPEIRVLHPWQCAEATL